MDWGSVESWHETKQTDPSWCHGKRTKPALAPFP